jgi:SAM-dependent methyltransferase
MEQDFYPAYYRLEGRHWWFVGRREILLRVLDRHVGRRARIDVLDFGCGTGAFLPFLQRYGSVSAVDGDEAAVAFCHQRGHAEVRHVAPGEPLPFADASLDLVTALDVVEHIADDVAALRELRRVLRPGGLLLVAVPAFMFLWGDQDEISHHFRRYTAASLRRSLQGAGFAVEHSSYFNTWLFAPIAALRVARRAIRRPSAQHTDFDIGPAWLNGVLSRLLASEAGAVSRARLPFGVSLLAVARRG